MQRLPLSHSVTAPLTRGAHAGVNDLLLTGIERPEKATVRPFQRDRAKPMGKGAERSEAEGEKGRHTTPSPSFMQDILQKAAKVAG